MEGLETLAQKLVGKQVPRALAEGIVLRSVLNAKVRASFHQALSKTHCHDESPVFQEFLEQVATSGLAVLSLEQLLRLARNTFAQECLAEWLRTNPHRWHETWINRAKEVPVSFFFRPSAAA